MEHQKFIDGSGTLGGGYGTTWLNQMEPYDCPWPMVGAGRNQQQCFLNPGAYANDTLEVPGTQSAMVANLPTGAIVGFNLAKQLEASSTGKPSLGLCKPFDWNQRTNYIYSYGRPELQPTCQATEEVGAHIGRYQFAGVAPTSLTANPMYDLLDGTYQPRLTQVDVERPLSSSGVSTLPPHALGRLDQGLPGPSNYNPSADLNPLSRLPAEAMAVYQCATHNLRQGRSYISN